MALFLNEDDILKPGESDQSKGDGIRKFCVITDKDQETDKNKTTTTVKRSVPLPELHINIDSDSDEDLPVVDFGDNKESRYKANEINNICDEQTMAGNESSFQQICKSKKSKHKLLSKSRPSLMVSPPKEYVNARKSKKKKAKRTSGGSTTTVEVIADTDNCDFVDIDTGDISSLPPINNKTINNHKKIILENACDTALSSQKQTCLSTIRAEVCNTDNYKDDQMAIDYTEIQEDTGCQVKETDTTRLSQLLPLIGGIFRDDYLDGNTNITNSDLCCVWNIYKRLIVFCIIGKLFYFVNYR